jgi:hypothetical protein
LFLLPEQKINKIVNYPKIGKMFAKHKINYFHYRLVFAVSILSAAIVSYEIQLVNFFTIVQWDHFAYMVISIALLGFGASGSVISIFRKWMLQRKDFLLPFLMISSGLLMTIAIRASRHEFFLFDSYILFVDSSQFSRLLGTYFLLFLPFFSGALAIGLIFVKKVSSIGTFYFSDLLGSGMGGALAIFLFWQLSPQEIPSFIAILPILAGVLIIRKKASTYLFSYSLLSLIVVVYHLNKPFDLLPSQYKSISYALNLPDAKINQQISSPFGLIQVVSSPVQRYAPGLSLTYTGNVPPSDVIFKNGDWYASIPHWSKKDTTSILNFTTMALPYVFGKPKRVMLFHAGAGLEIVHALNNGAEQITAIEPNATIISLLKNEYASLTDSLFYHPNLEIRVQTSRTFLNQTNKKYDIIQLPLLGAFGGSVGLNALQEENLLTKEAFAVMWQKLTPNGMIVLSNWIDLPPKISLKSAVIISESLESFQLKEPLNHIAAIRSWGTLTFVIKKKPLNKTEINKVKTFCERYNFDPLLLPGITTQERVQFNAMEDEVFFSNLDGIFGSQREKIIHKYDFNIQSATDNKPYFFQFLRLKKLPNLVKTMGEKSTVFLELGYLIAVVTFIKVIILALLFIILPLFRLGLKGGNKSWVVIYFMALGFGYMFLEIVFIKHFALYLGHTIYSVAIVISVMLISSGIGSYYSSRYKTNQKSLLKITGLITALILLYAFIIGIFLSSTVGLPFIMKFLLAGGIIALPSFFMGMPFPIGLKIVNAFKESNVPWAWGINGCVSVISTSLAVIIAVEMGFMVLMLFAAMAYGIAFSSNFFINIKGIK